jgi:hypothetical protein
MKKERIKSLEDFEKLPEGEWAAIMPYVTYHIPQRSKLPLRSISSTVNIVIGTFGR